MKILKPDVAIIGGGLGGCAAALAAARLGRRVVITESTTWLGGQLTSAAVPPDEHRYIEERGAPASYRELRRRIRDFYRANFPLTDDARRIVALNPGNGWVSPLCHDPRVAVLALRSMMAPHEIAGRLDVLLRHDLVGAHTRRDRVERVVVRSSETGNEIVIEAPYFIDATPLSDLIAHANVEHSIGGEARAETGEPHARERADPRMQQAFTFCFALEHLPGENHTIDEPTQYATWRAMRPAGWPGPLLDWTTMDPVTHEPLTRPLFGDGTSKDRSLWTFRRIFDRALFERGFARSDVTLVNWPQHDYWFGPLIGVDDEERARHLENARQLSLSLLYWMQKEAPRPDGGVGYPGLHLRADVVGRTSDGLAPAAYVRESRRIRAETTILEQHIAYPLREHGAELFADSVGVGAYRLDLHPRVGATAYLDLGCWPFQIPLGALLPVRVDNVLPGGKNLGTTHITNGAFRVHPVEWSVGESAGILAAFCCDRDVTPRAVRHTPSLLDALQSLLSNQGVELAWRDVRPL